MALNSQTTYQLFPSPSQFPLWMPFYYQSTFEPLSPFSNYYLPLLSEQQFMPSYGTLDTRSEASQQYEPMISQPFVKLEQLQGLSCLPENDQQKITKSKYPKKNAESNVINQIFSFLSIPSKCRPILTKILKKDKLKINSYFELIKQVKKRNKKYINREYIKNLIEMAPDHLIHQLYRKSECTEHITLQEVKRAIRILVHYYIENVRIPTILTSLKLDRDTKKEHLHRMKEVKEYLAFHLKPTKTQ